MIPATPSVRSDFGLAVTVGRTWNLVPAEIRQLRTLSSFKIKMKSFAFFLGGGVVVFVGFGSSMTQIILNCILMSGDVRIAVSWGLPVSGFFSLSVYI